MALSASACLCLFLRCTFRSEFVTFSHLSIWLSPLYVYNNSSLFWLKTSQCICWKPDVWHTHICLFLKFWENKIIKYGNFISFCSWKFLRQFNFTAKPFRISLLLEFWFYVFLLFLNRAVYVCIFFLNVVTRISNLYYFIYLILSKSLQKSGKQKC